VIFRKSSQNLKSSQNFGLICKHGWISARAGVKVQFSYKSNSRCDIDKCFGSWLRPRSTPVVWPARRNDDPWATDTGVCCIDDTVCRDGVCVAADGGVVYLDELTGSLVRPPVDDVPRSDMFRHEVRASLDNRPTQQG